jgi:hypothetical protein
MRPPTPGRAGQTGRPQPGTALAAAVGAAVLTGAGAVALAGGGQSVTAGQDSAPPAPAGVAATDASSSTSEAAAATDPLLTPPAVTWQLFAGVPLPYSATAGPRTIHGPVYAGFERSPTGALLAAAHLGTRYLLTPGSGWRQVVERQVLPGPGREAFVRLRATVDAADPPGTHGQPAGFRIVAFTPHVAVVQEALRFPSTGALQVTVTTLRWVGGDWRLELQPDGSTSPTAQAVPSLDGFVVWGM